MQALQESVGTMAGEASILVTGAGGFIGKRLVQSLRDRGQKVVSWTRDTGDLRDGAVVKEWLSAVAPKTIFNLAAMSGRSDKQRWQQAADDALIVSNLAEGMASDAVLIHTGSMAEYGSSGRFGEFDTRTPSSLYGFAKAAASDRAVTLSATKGLDIRVARLFAVYGPLEGAERLFPSLVGKLVRGEKVALSDGAQIRDFIHVDDVCSRLIALSNAKIVQPSIVNIGTGKGVSVRDVCLSVCNILKADPGLLDFGAIKRRPMDEDMLVAKTDQLATFGPVPDQHWVRNGYGAAAEYISSLAKGKKPPVA